MFRNLVQESGLTGRLRRARSQVNVLVSGSSRHAILSPWVITSPCENMFLSEALSDAILFFGRVYCLSIRSVPAPGKHQGCLGFQPGVGLHTDQPRESGIHLVSTLNVLRIGTCFPQLFQSCSEMTAFPRLDPKAGQPRAHIRNALGVVRGVLYSETEARGSWSSTRTLSWFRVVME